MVGHQANISQIDVDALRAIAAGELVLSSTGGTLTADGTEQTVYIDDEPLGLMRPVALIVDLDNMAGGDTVDLRLYHRLSDGGDLKVLDFDEYAGADGGLANGMKLVKLGLEACRHGFKVTLEQTGGVNRDYPWELVAEM